METNKNKKDKDRELLNIIMCLVIGTLVMLIWLN